MVGSLRLESEVAGVHGLARFLGLARTEESRNVLGLRGVGRGRERDQPLVAWPGDNQGHDPVARQSGNQETTVVVGLCSQWEPRPGKVEPVLGAQTVVDRLAQWINARDLDFVPSMG